MSSMVYNIRVKLKIKPKICPVILSLPVYDFKSRVVYTFSSVLQIDRDLRWYASLANINAYFSPVLRVAIRLGYWVRPAADGRSIVADGQTTDDVLNVPLSQSVFLAIVCPSVCVFRRRESDSLSIEQLTDWGVFSTATRAPRIQCARHDAHSPLPRFVVGCGLVGKQGWQQTITEAGLNLYR